MSERKPDQILDAAYDGIQEYDNDLPRWWVWLFVLTIVFAPVYTVYVHFVGVPTDAEALDAQLARLAEQRTAYAALHAPKAAGPELLLRIASEPARVAKGKEQFALKCAPCHGQSGEGVVGPNLTDEFWLHGGSIEKIRATIANGVPEKGMLAWNGLVSSDEIDELTAFLWTIRNTNVPGKAAQGDKAS